MSSHDWVADILAAPDRDRARHRQFHQTHVTEWLPRINAFLNVFDECLAGLAKRGLHVLRRSEGMMCSGQVLFDDSPYGGGSLRSLVISALESPDCIGLCRRGRTIHIESRHRFDLAIVPYAARPTRMVTSGGLFSYQRTEFLDYRHDACLKISDSVAYDLDDAVVRRPDASDSWKLYAPSMTGVEAESLFRRVLTGTPLLVTSCYWALDGCPGPNQENKYRACTCSACR